MCQFDREVWAILRNNWIYKHTCVTGCTVPLWTQVSCKLSWQFHLLVFHAQFCWMCCCSAGESDYGERLEWGELETSRKKTIICQNLCIIRCITSRTVDQNVPVWFILILSDLLSLSLYCDFVPNPLSGACKAHSSTYLCQDAEPIHSLHLPTTTSADFSEMGSVHLMERKSTWQILYMCYNPFTPLIISVTCLRFLAPEVNASWSCRSDFLPVNAGVLIVTLNTHSTAARRTTITWCNAWHRSTTFTHSESWISACYHHSGCETPMYVCTSTTHTIKINWVNVQ